MPVCPGVFSFDFVLHMVCRVPLVPHFVQVYNREEIPADMLVVGVHERYRPTCGGVCYVETKSLDGELYSCWMLGRKRCNIGG